MIGHLKPSPSAKSKLLEKNADDIVSEMRPLCNFSADVFQVITYAARTPLTKARKGGLKDTPVDDLLIALLTVRALLCTDLISPAETSLPDCEREV